MASVRKMFNLDRPYTAEELNETYQALAKSVLLEQQKDLSESIDQLLEDLSKGEKKMKVYKQMKMYNDETLNPVLYKKDE